MSFLWMILAAVLWVAALVIVQHEVNRLRRMGPRPRRQHRILFGMVVALIAGFVVCLGLFAFASDTVTVTNP